MIPDPGQGTVHTAVDNDVVRNGQMEYNAAHSKSDGESLMQEQEDGRWR